MKPSEILMKEIEAYAKWSGHSWYNKKPLHVDGVFGVNGITDYTVYSSYLSDLKEMIGTDLKRGDVLKLKKLYTSESMILYVNKDHHYTEHDIWDLKDEVFIPLEALDGIPVNYEKVNKEYQRIMNFVVRGIDAPLLDGAMINHVMETHQSLLVIRRTSKGDEFDRYCVSYFSNVGCSSGDVIDKYVTSCRKGNIVLVSHYTGYGYVAGANNTTAHIGVMDVSEEEAKKRGLKFTDMYIDYPLR